MCLTEENPEQGNDINFTLDETYKKKLQDEKKRLVLSRANVFPPLIVKNIVQEIQNAYNITQDVELTEQDTTVLIAIFFQQGATARSFDGNTIISIFDKQFTFAPLRRGLRNVGHKNTERKLARSLAEPIYQICEQLNIPGNLSKKIQRKNPELELSDAELVWLSDFQSDNLNCPPALRKLIQSSFDTKGSRTKTKLPKTGK